MCFVCVCHTVLPVPCSILVTSLELAPLSSIECYVFLCFFTLRYGVLDQVWYIENTRWVSFDIKFTRQGFENACWHREACWAIQHAFSKPRLVNLISKDVNLVFYLSVYPLLNTLQTSDYDVILMFVLIQCHKRRHSKSATSSWPDKGNMPWDRKRLLGHVETIQLILGVTDNWFYIFQIFAFFHTLLYILIWSNVFSSWLQINTNFSSSFNVFKISMAYIQLIQIRFKATHHLESRKRLFWQSWVYINSDPIYLQSNQYALVFIYLCLLACSIWNIFLWINKKGYFAITKEKVKELQKTKKKKNVHETHWEFSNTCFFLI